MTKTTMGLLVLGVVAAGLTGGMQAFSAASSPADMCVPMGTIVLKAPEGVKSQRASVGFPHARHFDVSCITCHHTWGLTEPVAGCMTSGCHDLSEAPKKKTASASAAEDPIGYFKAAYHKLCITCHKEAKVKSQALVKSLEALKKPLPKTGPTTCSGCHPK